LKDADAAITAHHRFAGDGRPATAERQSRTEIDRRTAAKICYGAP